MGDSLCEIISKYSVQNKCSIIVSLCYYNYCYITNSTIYYLLSHLLYQALPETQFLQFTSIPTGSICPPCVNWALFSCSDTRSNWNWRVTLIESHSNATVGTGVPSCLFRNCCASPCFSFSYWASVNCLGPCISSMSYPRNITEFSCYFQ
jgi:hypothetical protein